MAIQGPAFDWRMTCGWLRSRCLRRVPQNPFLAATYLGAMTGLGLGVLCGLVSAAVTASGGIVLGIYGLAVCGVAGIVTGLTIGILNGIVVTVFLPTSVLRARAGTSHNRVTVLMMITTCAGSFALLHTLFGSLDGIFVYPPVIAATLMAVPLSRKLRLP